MWCYDTALWLHCWHRVCLSICAISIILIAHEFMWCDRELIWYDRELIWCDRQLYHIKKTLYHITWTLYHIIWTLYHITWTLYHITLHQLSILSHYINYLHQLSITSHQLSIIFHHINPLSHHINSLSSGWGWSHRRCHSEVPVLTSHQVTLKQVVSHQASMHSPELRIIELTSIRVSLLHQKSPIVTTTHQPTIYHRYTNTRSKQELIGWSTYILLA